MCHSRKLGPKLMRTKFRIVKTRRKAAICITSKSPRLQKLDVKMHFDHGKARVLDRKRFEYVADPTIELAYSGTCTALCMRMVP